MYPSEYAYQTDSVHRNERASANCRNYQVGLESPVRSEDYIHCDGTQLRLTDSDFGPGQYNTMDYYVWSAGSRSSQLLFILPTRVNLTNITLHYYSADSGKGLPRLRFWAVPDDFDAWESPTASDSYVEVAAMPPVENSQSPKKTVTAQLISVNTKKILMVKFASSFTFVVSEVEFYNSCSTTHSFTSTEQDSTTDYLMSTSYVIKTTSTVDSEIISRTLSELNEGDNYRA